MSPNLATTGANLSARFAACHAEQVYSIAGVISAHLAGVKGVASARNAQR